MTTYPYDPRTGKKLHAGNMPCTPLTPMTQEQVDAQNDLVSRAADWDPGEENEDSEDYKDL